MADMIKVIQTEVHQTCVVFGGKIYKADTISLEGKLWLVPGWLDTPDKKHTMPRRLIHPLGQEFLPFGKEGYVLSFPVPKELFDERTPKLPIDGFEVRELPDIAIPHPTRPRQN